MPIQLKARERVGSFIWSRVLPIALYLASFRLLDHISFNQYSILAKVAIGLVLAIFFGGIGVSVVDVIRTHPISRKAKLKLEIKSRDGVVIASDVDPSNIDEIARALKGTKSAP